jgi:hypothetical protein
MRIRLGTLRRIIRVSLAEAGGGTTMPPRPVTRNPTAPSMADREQLGRISIKDMDDPEEVSPHLMEPLYDKEDCFGPVPPTAQNPYALPDFYTKDYNVIPTPQIKR